MPKSKRKLNQIGARKTTFSPAASVAVYTGKGSSAGWIWLVDVLDRAGWAEVALLEEQDLSCGCLADCEVLMVGDGDAGIMASALGLTGRQTIRCFVQQGGTFIACGAGSYLPLTWESEPISGSRLSSIKINNEVRQLPPCFGDWSKFHTRAGERLWLHPARGPVKLRWFEDEDEDDACKRPRLVAPLYRGPALVGCGDGQGTRSGSVEVLATYEDFLPATRFLTLKSIAEQMILGTVAALRIKYFDSGGQVLIFGPQLEAPAYAEANAALARLIGRVVGQPPLASSLVGAWPIQPYEPRICAAGGGLAEAYEEGPNQVALGEIGNFRPAPLIQLSQGAPAMKLLPLETTRLHLSSIRSALGQARLAAMELETTPTSWKVGKVIYEPEEITIFLEAIWSRLAFLEANGILATDDENLQRMAVRAEEAWTQLTCLRLDLRMGKDTTTEAAVLFPLLRQLARDFLKLYLRRRRAGVVSGWQHW